jgi:hypothetical protein
LPGFNFSFIYNSAPLPHPNEDKKDGSKRAGVGVIYKITDVSVKYK